MTDCYCLQKLQAVTKWIISIDMLITIQRFTVGQCFLLERA